MSKSENIVKVGAVAGAVTYGACCFIPFVGPLVGLVVGGGVFVGVEAAGFTGLGVYEATKGTYKGIKHLFTHHSHKDDINEMTEWHHHDKKHKKNKKSHSSTDIMRQIQEKTNEEELSVPVMPSSQNTFQNDKVIKNKNEQDKREMAPSASVTACGLYKEESKIITSEPDKSEELKSKIRFK